MLTGLSALGSATVLFALPLQESSGLAVADGRVHSVEDSGGPSTVFAFDRTGALVDEIAVDAENVDWEDLAIDDGSLFVGDIGDNRAQRDEVRVHRVPLAGGATRTFRFTYADGPRDAEGLVVSAGRAWVVSKELFGGGLYTAPLQDGAVLERVADVPVGLATGASLSPDGSLLAVRDYGGVAEWRVTGGDLAAALDAEPVRSGLPDTEQGEAVAYDGGPDALLTSTEGEGGPVHRLVRAVPPVPSSGPPGLPAPRGDDGSLPVGLLVLGAAAVAACGGLLALRRR